MGLRLTQLATCFHQQTVSSSGVTGYRSTTVNNPINFTCRLDNGDVCLSNPKIVPKRLPRHVLRIRWYPVGFYDAIRTSGCWSLCLSFLFLFFDCMQPPSRFTPYPQMRLGYGSGTDASRWHCLISPVC
ncbi:hypothetical protein GE21DRAFT_1000014 [Neurospora crassa]|nr:hypothetical protein GE21DRAFT_1000014 [Neurospora crassa]